MANSRGATVGTILRQGVPGLARNRWLPQRGYNKTNANRVAWHYVDAGESSVNNVGELEFKAPDSQIDSCFELLRFA